MAETLRPIDFFRASLDILRADGFEGLSAVAICEHLGVTRGSFYHHFGSFDAFVRRLMNYWIDIHVRGGLAEIIAAPDLASRSSIFIEAMLNIPHAIENQMRGWAGVNAAVGSSMAAIDEMRVGFIRDSLSRAGASAQVAELYAQIAHSTFVGLQIKGLASDEALVRSIFAEVERAFRARLD